MAILIQRRWIKILFVFIVFISFLLSLFIGYRRVLLEQSSKTVELGVVLQDVNRLALLGGEDRQVVLDRLKSDAGVTTLIVREFTLQDYIDDGKVTLLRGSEIQGMYRSGIINSRSILQSIYKRRIVEPDHFYIFIDEEADYSHILRYLEKEFGSGNVQGIDRWNIIEVSDELEDLLSIGLGIPEAQWESLSSQGFYLIPQLRNSRRLSRDIARHKIENLKDLGDVSQVLFMGESVLGYPTQMELMQDAFEDNKWVLGYQEFFPIKGVKPLALTLTGSVLRVHQIDFAAMDRLSFDRAVARYVRAARERGVRFVILSPFLKSPEAQPIVDYSMQFFKKVRDNMEIEGYRIGRAVPLGGAYQDSFPQWMLMVISLGVIALLFYLVHLFYPLNMTLGLSIFGALVFLLYACVLFGVFPVWNRVMGLIVAIVFPTLALVTQFPSKRIDLDFNSRILPSVLYLVRLLVISLVGSVYIVALMSDLDYLVSAKLFFGVKLSFIIPLFLIGLYFYLRPHRMQAIYFVFKRVLEAPVRTMYLLAVFFSVVFVSIYILRSGNYLHISVPFVETWMRDSLESFFLVRPRTKEFLIGYPFLMLAYMFVDYRISRQWLWFFNILGAVALISVVNSFCHFHTPIWISFYRSLIALGMGIGIGMVFISLVRVWDILHDRFNS